MLTAVAGGPDRGVVLQQFGDRIRRLREAAGLTQGQLGDAVGLHRVNINRLERGKQDVGVSHLWALAEALGVSPGTLLAEIIPKRQDDDTSP